MGQVCYCNLSAYLPLERHEEVYREDALAEGPAKDGNTSEKPGLRDCALALLQSDFKAFLPDGKKATILPEPKSHVR